MDALADVRPEPAFDPVQEACEESFPASDPPARTVVTGVGAPARGGGREEIDRLLPVVAGVKSPKL